MKKVKTRFLLVMLVGFLAGPTALAKENKWNEVPVEARDCSSQGLDKNYGENSGLSTAPAPSGSGSTATGI